MNQYNLPNISENDKANDKVGSSVATGAATKQKNIKLSAIHLDQN